ncbi:MAG: hypothetical protein M0Z98_04870 [Actinomycetales bacterium]|nr:hypothetical protein [Actinomycetales bacterium]
MLDLRSTLGDLPAAAEALRPGFEQAWGCFYFVDEASATVGGADLGRPVRVVANARIGDFALPARGVLAIGRGAWEIRDPVEYEATRAGTAGQAAAG